jgi:hypothetical protein
MLAEPRMAGTADVHRRKMNGYFPEIVKIDVVLITGAQRETPVPIADAPGQPELIAPKLASLQRGSLAQQNSPGRQQDVQRLQVIVADIRPGSPRVDDLAALAVATDAQEESRHGHAK